MVRLFIENNELELTNDVQVAITKQFEDLSNPTDIINDWSKTVSIPFTANNDRIFGQIYSPDKAIVDGGTIGVYFNPLLKLNFRLEWDDSIVMLGYAKLNQVKQVNGKGTYEITLFGELGKVFQEMQKITFDTTTDDEDYLIDGSQYVSEYINRNLVYSSWNSASQNESELKRVGEGGYNVNDIIGFAPNNAFSEDFKYDTFQNGTNSSDTFENVLGDDFTQDTGIKPDTIIPDGLLPREIGEYRSYLQLPFIYWNKLFKIFKAKAEEITGYEFDLDNDWFNNSNPYWYNLVYMLKPFNSQKGNSAINDYSGATSTELTWSRNTGGIPYSTVQQTNYTMSVVNEKVPRLSNNKFYLETYDNISVTDNTIDFYITGEMNHAHDLLFSQNNCFLFYLNFVGSNGYAETKTVIVYRGDTTNADVLVALTNVINEGGYAFPISYDDRHGSYYPNITSSSKYGWHVTVSGNNLLKLNKYKFGDYVTVVATSKWLNNSAVFGAAGSTSEFCWLSNANLILKMDIKQDTFNSNSYFTLNDLWNKEYNIFKEILKYCKAYRIAIKVDEYAKKISFKSYPNYFADYSVVDWTDKVDKSKDFNITPITFDKKYILFNYKESETKLGEMYKEKYGYNYGEYRLTTDYNFNSDTTELFDNVTPSITNTDNVLSWTNLNDYHKVIYSFPSEIYVYNKDDDNKQVDIFGAYYFHNGLAEFSNETNLHMRDVVISDDTLFQQNNNTYFYTQNQGEGINVSTYPKLDIVRGNNLCVFNVPKENYTYLNNYTGKSSIFTNFWENYINERYNIQNKKITCYVNIKPTDYNKFDWKQLVTVGNQLCMVNKIYDYDITNNQSTKVDLVTIQDISGYTTTPYEYDYIILSKHSLTVPYDAYKSVIVKSTGYWEINSDDWSENLVAYPQSGTSGETLVIIGTIDEELGGRVTFNLYDEDYNIIANDSVQVGVGGTNTISVSRWYNEISVGDYDYVDITSDSNWLVIAKDNRGGVSVDIGTESGSSGMTRRRMLVSPTSNTGIIDYYLGNANGDITSFRVNVVQ